MRASVHGRRCGRQHDAGSMQFQRAHLIGVLDMIGIGPEHGITGTVSHGTSKAREQAGGNLEPVFSAGMKHRNGKAEIGVIFHIGCRITAMRRASATIARLAPRRRASFAAQIRSRLARLRCIMTVAAWHSASRRLTSPALVIPPETSRSPDWLRDGVSPTHGPTFFKNVKRAGSSTADR